MSSFTISKVVNLGVAFCCVLDRDLHWWFNTVGPLPDGGPLRFFFRVLVLDPKHLFCNNLHISVAMIFDWERQPVDKSHPMMSQKFSKKERFVGQRYCRKND